MQALITEQKKGAFALYALFSVGIMLVTRYIPIDNAAPPRASEDAAVQEPLARTMALSYARSATLLKSPGLRAALMLTFLMLFIGDARGTFFILFLYEHGLSASAIGLLLSCGAVASMIVRPLGARLVERLPRALLVGTTVTMAVGAIAIIPTFQHPAAWALGVFIGSAAQLTPARRHQRLWTVKPPIRKPSPRRRDAGLCARRTTGGGGLCARHT